ncbi:hypothetical protein OROHE_017397 [Orobanche hederae]
MGKKKGEGAKLKGLLEMKKKRKRKSVTKKTKTDDGRMFSHIHQKSISFPDVFSSRSQHSSTFSVSAYGDFEITSPGETVDAISIFGVFGQCDDSEEDLTNGEHALHDTFDDDAIEVAIDDEYLTCDTFEVLPSEYLNLGPPTEICEFCGALMWKEERNNKSQKGKKCIFSMCCKVGEIKLPPQRPTPDYLKWLFLNSDHFRNNVRVYNSIFSFTSTGGIVDHNINQGRGPYCYRITGQNIHLLGSLLPPDGRAPKFCQLYICDTENEVDNRISALYGESNLDPNIVDGLMKMLDENNELAKGFRMARDRFHECGLEELKLIFISSRSVSGRPNHIGPSNEVGALFVGASDDHTCATECDIVVQSKEGSLHRVYETNKFFMALQYPLIFPHGESGFHLEIPYNTMDTRCKKKRSYVTMREWYSYDLMFRPLQGYTRRLGGRLYQQYIVDAYCAIEQYRLNWIQEHQETLRTDLYKSVRDAISRGDNDPNHIGKSYILPASFTGSRRYMSQYFQDSFAICRTIGHPSIFLTMTCNTKWPEIKEALEFMPGVRPEDCPDLLARIFKLKLEQLLDEIRNKNIFGTCIEILYVIEFQKRGLPHVHMLIWLHPDDRPKSANEIDKIVSAEIPNRDEDPLGYEAVKQFMIHGPCGDIN